MRLANASVENDRPVNILDSRWTHNQICNYASKQSPTEKGGQVLEKGTTNCARWFFLDEWSFNNKTETGRHVGHAKFVCLIPKMCKCSCADVPRNVKQNHTFGVVKQSRTSSTSIHLQTKPGAAHPWSTLTQRLTGISQRSCAPDSIPITDIPDRAPLEPALPMKERLWSYGLLTSLEKQKHSISYQAGTEWYIWVKKFI
jgi:hypothetical protein